MATNAPSWSSSSAAPWSPAPRAPLATQPPPAPPEPEDLGPARRSIAGPLIALAVVLALVAAGVVTWLVLHHRGTASTVLTPESVAGLTLDPDASRRMRAVLEAASDENKNVPVIGVYGSDVDGFGLLGGFAKKRVTAEGALAGVRTALGGAIGSDKRITTGGITVRCADVTSSTIAAGSFCTWTDKRLFFAAWTTTRHTANEVADFLAAARRAATP